MESYENKFICIAGRQPFNRIYGAACQVSDTWYPTSHNIIV